MSIFCIYSILRTFLSEKKKKNFKPCLKPCLKTLSQPCLNLSYNPCYRVTVTFKKKMHYLLGKKLKLSYYHLLLKIIILFYFFSGFF